MGIREHLERGGAGVLFSSLGKLFNQRTVGGGEQIDAAFQGCWDGKVARSSLPVELPPLTALAVPRGCLKRYWGGWLGRDEEEPAGGDKTEEGEAGE